MPAPTIRIWLETNHQPSFRAGGWAYVLAEGSALSGAAGGDRSATGEPIALVGLAEALKAAPPGAVVELRSASPTVAAAWRKLAATGDPPSADLDLWAQVSAALAGRTTSFTPAAAAPRTPTAFATAWAELARDKGKTRPFRAAIPKTNLAKAGVPA